MENNGLGVIDLLKKSGRVYGYKFACNLPAYRDIPEFWHKDLPDRTFAAKDIERRLVLNFNDYIATKYKYASDGRGGYMVPIEPVYTEVEVTFNLYNIRSTYTARHADGTIMKKTVYHKVRYQVDQWNNTRKVDAELHGYGSFGLALSTEFGVKDETDSMNDYFCHPNLKIFDSRRTEDKGWHKMIALWCIDLYVQLYTKTGLKMYGERAEDIEVVRSSLFSHSLA